MLKFLGFLTAMSFAGVAMADDDSQSTPSGDGEKAGCICTKEFRPVCSKDGSKQYGNACEARCAGVTDFTDGACRDGTMGSSGVGLQQTAADCKPGEVFKPFPCLVAPCKYGRCEGKAHRSRCGDGMMRTKVMCKPGAKDCPPFICVRRPQCGGIAGLQCGDGLRCVIAAKHPDASGSCYAKCKSNKRKSGCYDGEFCEDLKMITPDGVCKEKPILIVKPGVLKKVCGGRSKIKCAEGFYCLPKYRHINSEGTCVKRGGKVEPK
ncbi:MAG: hypothetical protein HYY84_00530 [Deltaproteobacteria bacterium]|nr:hypothetical protein [Deltaproteobacteria bacterium]